MVSPHIRFAQPVTPTSDSPHRASYRREVSPEVARTLFSSVKKLASSAKRFIIPSGVLEAHFGNRNVLRPVFEMVKRMTPIPLQASVNIFLPLILEDICKEIYKNNEENITLDQFVEDALLYYKDIILEESVFLLKGQEITESSFYPALERILKPIASDIIKNPLKEIIAKKLYSAFFEEAPQGSSERDVDADFIFNALTKALLKRTDNDFQKYLPFAGYLIVRSKVSNNKAVTSFLAAFLNYVACQWVVHGPTLEEKVGKVFKSAILPKEDYRDVVYNLLVPFFGKKVAKNAKIEVSENNLSWLQTLHEIYLLDDSVFKEGVSPELIKILDSLIQDTLDPKKYENHLFKESIDYFLGFISHNPFILSIFRKQILALLQDQGEYKLLNAIENNSLKDYLKDASKNFFLPTRVIKAIQGPLFKQLSCTINKFEITQQELEDLKSRIKNFSPKALSLSKAISHLAEQKLFQLIASNGSFPSLKRKVRNYSEFLFLSSFSSFYEKMVKIDSDLKVLEDITLKLIQQSPSFQPKGITDERIKILSERISSLFEFPIPLKAFKEGLLFFDSHENIYSLLIPLLEMSRSPGSNHDIEVNSEFREAGIFLIKNLFSSQKFMTKSQIETLGALVGDLLFSSVHGKHLPSLIDLFIYQGVPLLHPKGGWTTRAKYVGKNPGNLSHHDIGDYYYPLNQKGEKGYDFLRIEDLKNVQKENLDYAVSLIYDLISSQIKSFLHQKLVDLCSTPLRKSFLLFLDESLFPILYGLTFPLRIIFKAIACYFIKREGKKELERFKNFPLKEFVVSALEATLDLLESRIHQKNITSPEAPNLFSPS